VTGTIPTSGAALLVVAEDAEPERIITTALASGCNRPSVWITSGGSLIGYIAGAPSFVNVGFPSSVAAASPILLSCK
jgi:hypothetical protein